MSTATFIASGKQFSFDSEKKNQVVFLDNQKGLKIGDKITFEKVLCKDDEFGQTFIKGLKIIGEVLKHGKRKKITILKYKAKKRTKVKKGFRSSYTAVVLKSFSLE
jgi:large subunit ribosomal protein L21